MKQIDEKILKYCGIYKKVNITNKQKQKILDMKKDLEKLTGMKIEKVFVYGKGYWGKDASVDKAIKNICFLVDERLSSIDKVGKVLDEYVTQKNESSILFWSLCQFEKRKNIQEEAEYYISRYGELIYDSNKEPEIDERIQTTIYAARNNYFKFVKRYISSDRNGILMYRLLEIYLLKIGYYVEENELNLEELIDYINYVSNDKKIKLILQNYINEENEQKRKEICNQFEEYINTVKQVVQEFKLKNNPTMQVYEKLKAQFDKNGKLDLKTLTKEDLYIMYVIQGKNTFEIAQLYGVDNKKINNKRKNIKIKEAIINSENMKKLPSNLSIKNKALLYLAQKQAGLLSFEDCLYEMLEFMKSGEKYLLKEFWKFTEFPKLGTEEVLIGENTTTWYRATLGMQFLKDNELVEEVEFKKYKITKKGREMVRTAQSLYETKIDLPFLISFLGRVYLFGVCYEREDGKEIKKQKELEKVILEVAPNKEIHETEMIKDNATEELINEETTTNVNEKKVLDNTIDELQITKDTKFNCQFKEYKSERKRNSSTQTRKAKENTSSKQIEISDKQKSNLGIKGETYLYKCLKLKKTELMKKLEIDNYKDILFYNIDYDKTNEDKSVGHGCDIEIILNNGQHLYIEVKTSLENIEYYTMTHNEYKCNYENQDNYFIIKVNNFKYLNKAEDKIIVTIIKNPYKIFMENIEILKEIVFYTKY